MKNGTGKAPAGRLRGSVALPAPCRPSFHPDDAEETQPLIPGLGDSREKQPSPGWDTPSAGAGLSSAGSSRGRNEEEGGGLRKVKEELSSYRSCTLMLGEAHTYRAVLLWEESLPLLPRSFFQETNPSCQKGQLLIHPTIAT